MFRVNVKLNIRSAARLSAARIGRAEPGTRLEMQAALPGDTINGQGQWYELIAGQGFVWGGGVVRDVPPPTQPAEAAGPAPAVNRRADHTILPLSTTDLMRFFGQFRFREAAKKGFIDIEPEWIRENTELIPVPALAQLDFPNIRVHKKAARHFAAVFDEIAKAGLSDLLLSCAGTFVPRHISRDLDKPLSSHSWGVAIDLNAEWNGYGQRPAARNTPGSLQDVAPIFATYGFAWGGHFGTPDGMHFELARKDV
ncbi:M15 family metallopeptidase [Peristeroidobacter soli]|uniref:M15 family metallopeptidase n=1 Tax=Peristeroidobacter soli TaxID=2497877 RepID=UPI00158DB1E9|nr:M15 family metallopeptidase [Peristeroidobacter soli]